VFHNRVVFVLALTNSIQEKTNFAGVPGSEDDAVKIKITVEFSG